MEAQLRAMSLHEQVAHTIIAAAVAPGDTLSGRLEAELTTGAAGGLLLPPTFDSAQILTGHFRAKSPWPLLLLVDRRGEWSAGAEIPPARLLAPLAGEGLLREAGQELGRRTSEVGAHLLIEGLSPLNADEPLSALRSNAPRVAEGLGAFVDGVRKEGTLVGVASLTPAAALGGTLDWDRARLTTLELRELRGVLEHDVAAVMLGSVALPALTGDSTLLPASPAAAEALLRRDLGFEGVVMADLSPGSPLVERWGTGDAAVALLAGGTDLLVGTLEPARVVDAVVAAVEAGDLPRTRVADAARRVLRLRRMAGIGDTLAAEDSVSMAVPAAVARREFLAPPEFAVAVAAAQAAAEAVAQELRARAMDSVVAATGLTAPPEVVWPPAPVLRVVPADSVGMSAQLGSRIDAIMRQALEDSVFTGAAVAVARQGGLVLLRGYGSSGREGEGLPVDPRETLFDLASLTKVVATTTAVALLVDDGRVELDAPVVRYLEDFVGEDKEDVLVRHLLTHTSGLPAGLWLFGSARSPDRALREVLEQPLLREPGERVQYSDLGMVLLAELVERVAEAPIDEFLAARLFAPLGMQRTMYLPPLALRDRIVPTAEKTERDFPLQGVVHDANSFRLGGIAGHAGLFSTARDVAVFGQMMLNGGSYGTLRILQPATVGAFAARQPGADQRALGWDTPSRVSSAGAYFSSSSFGHTGYTGTSLWIDPARDLLVVLLTNRTYTGASAREILDLRTAVHDAAARGIADGPVRRR